MSATATDPAVNGTETHVVNDPGMGGTSAEGDVQADGVEELETQEGESADVSSEGEEVGEEPAPQTKGPDPSYVADLEQRVQQSNAIAGIIVGHPEREAAFAAWAKEDQGGGGEDWVTTLDKEAEQRFPGEEDRAAVRAIFGPMARRLADLEKRVGGMVPQVQQSSALARSAEFAGSLTANGVSAKEQATPEFKAFLASERRDPEFQRDEQKRAAYAGKNLARAWRARSATVNGNAATRRQVADLKGGRLHAASTGANGSSRVAVIDDTKPGWDAALLKLLEQNPSLKWEYKSSRK